MKVFDHLFIHLSIHFLIQWAMPGPERSFNEKRVFSNFVELNNSTQQLQVLQNGI